MKYKMVVDITDPNTPKGMFSGLRLKLECNFIHNPNNYGNGFYLFISGEDFHRCFDLRYDKSFNFKKPEKWLENWANNYWNGENGAWVINKLKIVYEETKEDYC